jgi:hypothetical protein
MSVPSGCTAKTDGRSGSALDVDMNAIHFPSGDHAGKLWDVA